MNNNLLWLLHELRKSGQDAEERREIEDSLIAMLVDLAEMYMRPEEIDDALNSDRQVVIYEP